MASAYCLRSFPARLLCAADVVLGLCSRNPALPRNVDVFVVARVPTPKLANLGSSNLFGQPASYVTFRLP